MDKLNLATSSLVESARTQQQFLRFRLLPDLTALIEIEAIGSTKDVEIERQRHIQVTELVNIQIDRVVPMPHLPSAVMGVYNWRGEILWIVDLAMLLGVTTGRRYRSLQPTIILASSTERRGKATAEDRQEQTIGLVVDEIAEIEWYEPEQIRPLELAAPALSTWVRGVWTATGENFLVVDGQAIFDRPDFDADV